ncbi:MAG: hypothetical protein ACE5R6_20840 [Candidatus Heimdallarchaeota archaeon]
MIYRAHRAKLLEHASATTLFRERTGPLALATLYLCYLKWARKIGSQSRLPLLGQPFVCSAVIYAFLFQKKECQVKLDLNGSPSPFIFM